MSTASEHNHDRAMVAIIQRAAMRLGLRVEALGQGWILRLSKPGAKGCAARVRHIHGYSFDLNPAGTHEICCDKAATAQVLESAGVACVPHTLVLHPEMARFVPLRGSWPTLLEAFGRWGSDLVVKENAGTGGRGVTRCRSVVELEQAVYKLFQRTTALAASPFMEIEREVRCVMLRGACELAYEKVRATVVGDGRQSVVELLCEQRSLSRSGLAALLENLDEQERRALADVPGAREVRLLNWRHNLGQGASARLLETHEASLAPALRTAQTAAEALGLVFGSVDVVSARGCWSVLEVNAGVMMEFLARASADGARTAERIYGAALEAMFEPTRDG